MKKLLFAASAFLGFYLISCNNNSENDKNVSASKDIFKGIETGDTTKFASIDAEAIDHAGPHGDVKGADSIKAYLADMHNHIKDLKFDIMGNATDGDYVYTWNKMTGTPTDTLMGFPAGVPMSIKGVDIIRYSNGKAVEHWGNVDQHDLMMIRAMKMPGATIVKVNVGDTSNNKDTSTKK